MIFHYIKKILNYLQKDKAMALSFLLFLWSKTGITINFLKSSLGYYIEKAFMVVFW